ncbi:phosphate ABC transporter substrate-binding protein PstS [Oscillatoria sp. FACHB-1406]|uniref:phosphate ABC transporter substrate-binding protein PstS n=1 Tax=Oscillatoria sp. FACHB-1406 TaxID=2692846 RepID=UPI001683E3DB|nr:phosphate ABC transporter substrate-binding protein PstS [Oscillatoria sp. FACHB-1406]MBD2578013.1 phosphate ABC transporter substrate-binding protein PstS [Oscillatoria sp. FACHB-1406]
MLFSTATLRRMAAISVTTLALSASAFSAIAQAITLNGAGASFPKPLYDRYFAEIKSKKDIQVNYEAIGSGGGIRQFIADTVDFAGSDAVPKSTEKDQMKKGVLMVPTAGGAVAVIYNLPGVNNLQISRDILPKIFLGEITNWKQVAPNLPDKPIRVVVRSDGSGTTEIFTGHLAAISPTFNQKVGENKAPTWPGQTLGGEKNAGVAAVVQRTEGAIGYVQADYAFENSLRMAKVQNKVGQYLDPSIANANKAFDGVRFNPDFTTANANDPESGYPIIGVTWLLLKLNYDDPEKAQAVKDMVQWILTDGQNINNSLQYTKIPSAVAQQAIEEVNSKVKANP